MLSQSLVLTLQVYAIAAAISLLVAVIIKTLVKVTGHVEKRTQRPATAPLPKTVNVPTATASASKGIPHEKIAVVTAAVAAIMGPHRILRIAQGGRSWASQGRTAQHSHQPKR